MRCLPGWPSWAAPFPWRAARGYASSAWASARTPSSGSPAASPWWWSAVLFSWSRSCRRPVTCSPSESLASPCHRPTNLSNNTLSTNNKALVHSQTLNYVSGTFRSSSRLRKSDDESYFLYFSTNGVHDWYIILKQLIMINIHNRLAISLSIIM